ncbi:MAG TPA: protein-glutamate O-methyltransferase CheR [Actinomycetota bacterium]|nr:protein-glutamate O-methyltransferase CheR [Actinomycetota bacterium]
MTTDDANGDLEVLLDYLRRSRGFDFTGYKRTSLSRRIEKRMQTVGADGYLGYLDHLEVDPEEFTHLFNTILINVTGFFRDPLAWEYLAAEVLPRLAADKRDGEPIRVWSAGCASGEEAYTLAMAIAEALGPETVKERVKIYATDVDEDALNQARQARYTAKQVEGVPAELLERYFERNGHGYVFSNELRRSVVFGRHDLIQDAPISRIDLLVCRNTLMYLNSDTQAHVLARSTSPCARAATCSSARRRCCWRTPSCSPPWTSRGACSVSTRGPPCASGCWSSPTRASGTAATLARARSASATPPWRPAPRPRSWWTWPVTW